MLDRMTPTRDVERLLDEVDRIVTEGFSRTRAFPFRHGIKPAVDLYDTGEDLVVKALMPGAKLEDIELWIEQNVLTLQGSYGYALSEEEAKRVTWYQRGIVPGWFAETMALPVPVESEHVSAAFVDGVLTLTLPKVAQARSKRIPIQGRSVFAGKGK